MLSSGPVVYAGVKARGRRRRYIRRGGIRKAERFHDAAVSTSYTEATGPAHQLKHLAELATTAEREDRDAAELVYRRAEQDLKQAGYRFWAAMGGAAPEAGDR